MSAPGIKVISVSKNKISDISGQDMSVVKFAPTKTIVGFEARAGGIYAGSGLLVGRGEQVLPASDLYPGESLFPNDYRIEVPNELLNPTIDHSGWSKSYNTGIVYSYDGPEGPNEPVATFRGASGDSSSYWYSYGDLAPQEDNTKYMVSIWVKVVDAGYATIRYYTADNSEANRVTGEYIQVNQSDGWVLCIWNPFTTTAGWASDSLSFYFTGTWGANSGRLALSAPRMVKVKEVQFEVENEELQQDGEYRVNIYGLGESGEWTPYE